MSDTTTAAPTPPGRLEGIADYNFVRFLGEGNHGQFYLALPPVRIAAPGEYVAVKVLAGYTGKGALEAMAKELKVFAAVESPHLARLLDAGQEGPTCFYAMEYYPLGSLAAPGRPLSRGEVRHAVADASRGAHALHEAGIAHRDIKPGNILLDGQGGRLSDLGLAQILEPGRTITGMNALGSVEYMDPAIIKGGRASRASDIWAIGVTLHHCLSGVSVYGDIPEHDPLLALRHVLKAEPTVHPSLEPGEADIVRACLAADASARPTTALEVAERIDAL